MKVYILTIYRDDDERAHRRRTCTSMRISKIIFRILVAVVIMHVYMLI